MGTDEYIYIGLYLEMVDSKFNWYEFNEKYELSDVFHEPEYYEKSKILLINGNNGNNNTLKLEFEVGYNKIIDFKICEFASKIMVFQKTFKKILDLFKKYKIQYQIKNGIINYSM